MDKTSLSKKDKYFHREFSWLAFNQRVLEEAADSDNPLFERLKFSSIVVSNLDEFFMVRVAGIKNLIDSGYNREDTFGFFPQDIYAEIKERSSDLIKKLYSNYRNRITKDLEKHNIFIKDFDGLNEEQKKFAKKYFDSTLFPIITPMAVDGGRPFPVLPSKTIGFAIHLSQKEESLLAILPIPKNIPRLVKVPPQKDEYSFILIDDIIRQYLGVFFRGYKINDFSIFRILRDGEIAAESEFAPDLLKAIDEEVKKRPWAKVVYLEIEKDCTPQLLEDLCAKLDFKKEEVITISDNLDLSYLPEISQHVDKPELCYKDYLPVKLEYGNIFDKINEGDFIVHVPYQAFDPTIDLIQTAANDVNVLGIKMTLYRTNYNSAIIQALKEAARNKKQVTILVEIKARFEEEKNIQWSRELEEAGCHVIYGITGLKIHSKMTLIVRREEGRIRRYVHLSTGNYNEITARVYTDIGYFTSNDDFARDISDIFNVITGYSLPSPWKRIVSAPNDLRKYFLDLIDNEIEFHKRNKNGFIFAKMNSLEDPAIIEKLYEASREGVRIRLIVRGICCLIPGIKNVSDTIEVKSIVGRFLEHSRIFYFHNNNSPRIFLSSADWMRRNFDRRIELLFEISKLEIKEHLQYLLETCWKDNIKARALSSECVYSKQKDDGGKHSAQEFLIQYYALKK